MKLLQLKHWQLFIITFAAPFVCYLIAMAFFAVKMFNLGHKAETNNMAFAPQVSDFIIPIIFGILSFLISLVMPVWMYQIGTKLQNYMNTEMRPLKVKRFRIFFFFPLAYIVFLGSVAVPTIISATSHPGQGPGSIILLILIMFLGHFFTFFCVIFTLYFLAKTLKSAELQREAHFSDYIGEFFLFWFFPVGVWFIQPKVNRIINGEIPEIREKKSYSSGKDF